MVLRQMTADEITRLGTGEFHIDTYPPMTFTDSTGFSITVVRVDDETRIGVEQDGEIIMVHSSEDHQVALSMAEDVAAEAPGIDRMAAMIALGFEQ